MPEPQDLNNQFYLKLKVMAKQKPKQKLLEVEHVSETEITSLNGNLLNEFSIEELEARYETDPLMLSHLLGLVDSEQIDSARGCECRKLTSCPNLQCLCDGEKIECNCNGVKEAPDCPLKIVCEFGLKK